MAQRPFIVIAGDPGAGKSYAALKSAREYLYVASASNNAHYYKKSLNGKLKDGPYKPPKRMKLIGADSIGTSALNCWLEPKNIKRIKDDAGNPLPVSNMDELEKTILSVRDKCLAAVEAGEDLPYWWLILDEWGEFIDRVFEEIKCSEICTTKAGKVDGMKAHVEIISWVVKICGWLRTIVDCGCGVAVIMHSKPPDAGQKGGPVAVNAAVVARLCRLSDGVLMLVIKNGPSGKPGDVLRLWNGFISEEWHQKLRGLDPEDAERIGPMELEEILALCDFTM